VSHDREVFSSERPELPADAGNCEIDGPLEAQDEDAPAPWPGELVRPAAVIPDFRP
jgi:hypothetical protein